MESESRQQLDSLLDSGDIEGLRKALEGHRKALEEQEALDSGEEDEEEEPSVSP